MGLEMPPVLATLVVLATGQAAPRAPAPAVVITYRAATEDDASTGRLRLMLAAGRIARAVVWERECTVSSRTDVDSPAVDADQYWTFRVDLAKDATGQPAARVRYRLMKPDRPGKEEDRLLRLDGKDTLAIDGLSARTDCRYDRIHVLVSGG
jgi:hypothetical protein